MSLRQRVIRAGAWTVASYGVELSARLLSNLVLARLLFPDAFGVIAAATALIAGLQLISDFGVKAVIIQNPLGDDPEFLRSAWVFQLWRGSILWLLLAVICSLLYIPAIHILLPAASVFAYPPFPAITIVLGFSLILGGLESTAVALNMRNLNLGTLATIDVVGRLAPIPVMIAWAFFSPTVWSLAAGSLVGAMTRLVLSHTIVPGPSMAFSVHKKHIDEIVSFGKWVNLSSVATLASSQASTVILGVVLPGSTLGLFYIAKTLSDAIESLLERLNGTLTLPVLSEIVRKEPRALRAKYYRFRLPIDVIAAGTAGFLLSSGNLIVHVLYDSRYSESGLMLEILSLGLLIYPLQIIRSAFTAVARANLVAWVSVVQAVALLACLSAGYHFGGVFGAIFGIAASRIFPSAVILTLANRRSWLNISNELRLIPIFAFGFLVSQAVNYCIGP